jgi:hypothetical protein
MIGYGPFHPEEEMMSQNPRDTIPKTEKPARKGPVGLLLYGALTILGALALVLVAE